MEVSGPPVSTLIPPHLDILPFPSNQEVLRRGRGWKGLRSGESLVHVAKSEPRGFGERDQMGAGFYHVW